MVSKKEMKIHIDLLKRRGNFYSNIDMLISLNNGNDYFNIIKKYFIPSNPINRKSFFHNNYDDVFKYTRTGKTSNLSKMLLWSSSIISFYKDEIIEFVSMKKRFDYYVLVGDYKNATKTLDYIDSNISFSVWSLKNRMMLANLEGVSVDECIRSLGLNKYATAHANLFVHLTKLECDTGEYFKNIEHIAETLSKEYVNCFLYLYGGDYFKIKECAEVLLYCNSYSIIDSFLCVKWIIHQNLCSKEFKNSLLERSIKVLSCIENDNEILLFSSFESFEDIHMSDVCQTLCEDFVSKKYEDVFLNRNDYLTEVSDCSLVKLIIITMSGILSNKIDSDFSEINILDSIILSLYRVLKSDNLLDFRLALSKIAGYNRVLRWFDLSSAFSCFWGDCLGFTEEIVKKCFSTDDKILYFKITNLEFPPIFFESLCHYLETDFGYDDIEKDFDGNYGDVFSISLLYIQYYVALNKKDYSFASNIYSKSLASFLPLTYRFESRDLCNYVTENITIKESIDISDVILSFAISDLYQYKNTAYKNFLDENDIIKPLDIINLSIDKQLKVYFLKEICTIDTMTNLYFAFSNSNEVENHRIEICKFLIEYDSLNKGVYSKEISEILKEQEVRKLNRTIDKSKLSVDYQYIFEKTYDRFLGLIKSFCETDANSLECVSYGSPVVSRVDVQSWRFIAYSRDVILEKMYKVYASEFCFGSRGLDTYLSTRVRHGTFENTIKKVFMENNLYNTDNNFFKPLFLKGHMSRNVVEVVMNFQKQLICKIHTLTNMTFKVYIENKIDGALFNYCMNAKDLNVIYQHLLLKSSFLGIDFVNAISDAIVTKTNDYLAHIRDEILESFKSEIIELLNRLSNDVESYCLDSSALSNIRNNISRCKTSIQNKIDEIKNWFYLSESTPLDNYTIDKLTEVLNKNLCQQFDDFNLINLTIENSVSEEFLGETFVYIYDVLHILLSNAIIHSKFEHLKDLEIVFEITAIDNELVCFCIKNNFSQACDFGQIRASIEKINDIYLNKGYTKLDTHKEGGMGQIKVLDILYNILNVGNSFEASCDSNNYEVKFTIVQKGVIAHEQ